MKVFKRTIATLLVAATIFASPSARSDLFGGDVAVLTQILTNAIKQLVELQKLLSTSQDNLTLIRNINKGINDSLNLIQTLNPNIDPGIFRDWKNIDESIKQLESIYGIAVNSPLIDIHKNLDRGIVEAITKNNATYEFTKKIDLIGEQIKAYSHEVSPGGAQKLTAQSMGVMLHVMNEGLRSQATALKLQAHEAAEANRQEKARTRHVLETSNTLKTTLKTHNPKFTIPRFN